MNVYESCPVLHSHAYELFGCPIIATKAPAFAAVRQQALRQCGYMPSASMLIGSDDTAYGDYWVRLQASPKPAKSPLLSRKTP